MPMCKVKSVKFSVSTHPKRRAEQNESDGKTFQIHVVRLSSSPSSARRCYYRRRGRGAFVALSPICRCNLRQTRRNKTKFSTKNFQFTRFVQRCAMRWSMQIPCRIPFAATWGHVAYFIRMKFLFACIAPRSHAILPYWYDIFAAEESTLSRSGITIGSLCMSMLQLQGHYQIFRLHQSQSYRKCAWRWAKELAAHGTHGTSAHSWTSESTRFLNNTALNLNWIVVPLVRYLPFAVHFLWLYHGCSASSSELAMVGSRNIIISSSGIEFTNTWAVRANALAWTRTMEKFQFFLRNTPLSI